MYVTMRQTEWPAAAAFLPELISGAHPTPSIRAGCTPELQWGTQGCTGVCMLCTPKCAMYCQIHADVCTSMRGVIRHPTGELSAYIYLSTVLVGPLSVYAVCLFLSIYSPSPTGLTGGLSGRLPSAFVSLSPSPPSDRAAADSTSSSSSGS